MKIANSIRAFTIEKYKWILSFYMSLLIPIFLFIDIHHSSLVQYDHQFIREGRRREGYAREIHIYIN